MQKRCPTLKKGDKVRIIAPGATSPIVKDTSQTHWQDLEKCCELLQSWGLRPEYAPDIFADDYKSYYNFANTDLVRARDFMEAFLSDATVVWSFRGGYGSDRVIAAALENNFQPSVPKLFIGFSDVTNLHNYIGKHWQWNTLHALSLRQLGLQFTDVADVALTREIIFGEKTDVQLTLKPLNATAQKQTEIHAQIAGGNLSIVQAAIGTPWATPMTDKILLLEDVDEAPYRLARIFQQLLASDLLAETKAVILGDFIPTQNTELVLEEFAALCSLPVLRCEGIGHSRVNHPVPLGTAAKLVLGNESRLEVAAT